MKKSLLLLNLISMILIALPQVSFAKKKYRYIKREHGVRVSLDWPKGEITPNMKLTDELNFNFTYTYNWKGFLEVGPYLKVEKESSWMVDSGLLVEWNIIKNRGKRALIPAVGLKIGADDFTGTLAGHIGFPLSLKFFAGERNFRTPLIITVEPYIEAPGFTSFTPLTVKINTTVGFEYYFDFY